MSEKQKFELGTIVQHLVPVNKEVPPSMMIVETDGEKSTCRYWSSIEKRYLKEWFYNFELEVAAPAKKSTRAIHSMSVYPR